MPRDWQPDEQFTEYARFIVEHPNYSGMPDVYWDDKQEEIQWETPSNRTGGKFQFSHAKRLEWWKNKARQIGIDPDNTSQWISKVAKTIHPTGKKPCKVCGRVMVIGYAYPSYHLRKRIRDLPYIDPNFVLDETEHTRDLITRLVEDYSDNIFKDLPMLLKSRGIVVPQIENNLELWLDWIETTYIPQEPSILSPGAMSNAPDRFDGFHTFNRCCRSKADKGRHKDNLRSYATDRRVFEYWSEGNWTAANKLMGLVRTTMQNELCRNGHEGVTAADHIGPISLGFTHRPQFQMLCNACNSSKNNRMMYSDVRHLLDVEKSGESVVSWYAKPMWDLRKHSVDSTETALRLSKLMRDNWHNVSRILGRIAEEGYFTFLATFLSLEYADYDYEFANLRVEQHITKFDKLHSVPKTTKYAIEQKARACRVALESLITYVKKENRNLFTVSSTEIEEHIQQALNLLKNSSSSIQEIDAEIEELLSDFSETDIDRGYRHIVGRIPAKSKEPHNFALARLEIEQTVRLIAQELSLKWTDDRYVRSGWDLEEF